MTGAPDGAKASWFLVRDRDPRPAVSIRGQPDAIRSPDLGWYSTTTTRSGRHLGRGGRAVDVTLSAWERRHRSSGTSGLRAGATTRPSRGRRLVRRLLLPQQRGDRGAGVDRSRRARRDPRRRLPPRQRHPADLLRPRRRAVRLAARRSRRRIPVLSRVCHRTRRRTRRGYTHNFPLPLGNDVGDLPPGARRAAGRSPRFGADALVVSLGVDTAAEDADRFELVGDDFHAWARRSAR